MVVRTWRSGKSVEVLEPTCVARTAIGIFLKRVDGWAMQFSSRTNFEWIWGCRTVWLVQADDAATNAGVDPRCVIPKHIPVIRTDQLGAFRTVDEPDFATYGKLRNASRRADLGYQMPPFYSLND